MTLIGKSVVMKKLSIFAIIPLTLAMGCNKISPVESLTLDTIQVSLSQPADENGTKTTLIGSNTLGWHQGDVLYVSTPTSIGSSTTATDYNVYTTNDVDKTASANFTKTSGEIAEDSHYAVMYSAPVSDTFGCNTTSLTRHTSASHLGKVFSNQVTSYLMAFVPCHQTYVENGLAQYTMPMYGYVDDLNDIKLTCLGSILRFNLYTASGDNTLKSITIQGFHDSSAAAIAGGYGIARASGMVNSESLSYASEVDVDKYFGPWSLASTNGLGADKIVYDCGDASLSNDPSNPTQFNVVFAVNGKAVSKVNKLDITVTLTGGATYHTQLSKSFSNNTVYSLKTKNVDSF